MLEEGLLFQKTFSNNPEFPYINFNRITEFDGGSKYRFFLFITKVVLFVFSYCLPIVYFVKNAECMCPRAENFS